MRRWRMGFMTVCRWRLFDDDLAHQAAFRMRPSICGDDVAAQVGDADTGPLRVITAALGALGSRLRETQLATHIGVRVALDPV